MFVKVQNGFLSKKMKRSLNHCQKGLKGDPQTPRYQWMILVLLKGCRDYITPRGRQYIPGVRGIYCPLGDDILSTTLYKKQNNPMKDIARQVSSACCCGLKEGDVEVLFGTSPPPP